MLVLGKDPPRPRLREGTQKRAVDREIHRAVQGQGIYQLGERSFAGLIEILLSSRSNVRIDSEGLNYRSLKKRVPAADFGEGRELY